MILLSGCNPNDEGTEVTNTKTLSSMKQNIPYTLNRGDKIIKKSSDAKVQITKNSEQKGTEVILLVGEAEINKATL